MAPFWQMIVGLVVLAIGGTLAWFGGTLAKDGWTEWRAKPKPASSAGANQVSSPAPVTNAQTATATAPNSTAINAGPGANVMVHAGPTEDQRRADVDATAKATASQLNADARAKFKDIPVQGDLNQYPLRFVFSCSETPYSAGTVFGGITWSAADTDLRLFLHNPSDRAIEEISFIVQFDRLLIRKRQQITKVPDVVLWPTMGGGMAAWAMEVVMIPKGATEEVRVPVPMNNDNTIGTGVQILCPKLLPGAHMELIFACRSQDAAGKFLETRVVPRAVRIDGSYVYSQSGEQTRYILKNQLQFNKGDASSNQSDKK